TTLTVRWLRAVTQFDAVRKSPVGVRGDIAGERVVYLSLRVTLFSQVEEPSRFSPHDCIDLARTWGRRDDEAATGQVPPSVDPPAYKLTGEPRLTDLVPRLDDHVLVVHNAHGDL